MNGLATAIGLFTRIPVSPSAWRPDTAAAWLPAIGVILGGVTGCLAWAVEEVLPPPAAAAVIVACWAAVTGALHLDGLADAADAAFVSAERDRRVAILRDVHHGTYGVTTVALVLLLKFGGLAALEGTSVAAAVFASTAVARCWLPLAARLQPAMLLEGMGAGFRQGCTVSVAAIGFFVALGSGWFALGSWGLVAAVAGGAVSLGTAFVLGRAFGGLNGDTYGACVELAECAALLTAAGLATKLVPFGAVV